MLKEIKPAVRVFFWLTLICGFLYPLTVTGIARVFFAHQANGSLVVREGQVVGSELIGQAFDGPEYFWGRVSATTPAYNGAASAGSNLGPTNPALVDRAKARLAEIKTADPLNSKPVPADLVTASASGLDPHISPAAAYYQVDRVAVARGLNPADVRQIVNLSVENRLWGLLGEPRVNVLLLNLLLDRLQEHPEIAPKRAG